MIEYLKNKSGRMKKGFTLVEVMATIVILAVILLIAVPIYNGVRENINESVYESKLREILSKAESYATETNSSVFDVKTLIESGRISADNETGIYVDPRTNRDMRCDVINAVYKEQRYEVSITESSTCYSLEELENLYGIVELVLENEAGEEIESIEGTDWLQENKVYVRYRVKEAYQEYENSIQSIFWYGEREQSCSKENLSECLRYEVSADLIKNSVVNLRISFEVAGVEIITQNQKNVLLDLQRPSVVEGSIRYDNSISSVSEREVEFEVSDGSGSGIKEYAIISSPNCESIEYEENKQSSEGGVKKVYLNNGEYYICVKDKVGNKSNEEETRKTYFKVENVDQTKDRIDYEIESHTKGVNGWYQAITIRGIVEENGSGIDRVISCVTTGTTCEPSEVESISNNRFSKKLSSNSNAQRICARVIDKAGNVSDVYCSSAYKVDEINPSASVSINSSTSGSNGWYKALSIKASLSDSHSGVSSAKYCTTSSTCTPSTNASISNNSFTVTLGNNGSAQKVCVNVTDNSGRTSSTVCSSAYKVDTTNPSLSWTINSSTSGSNGWYKALSLKASLSDNASGISSAKYCTTTGSSCTPNTNASISNNGFTVTLGSNASAQRVCANVTDKSGRTSSTICSGTYKVDTNNPSASITSATVDNNNATVKIVASGSDSHSKIKNYAYKLDSGSWYSSFSNTYTFQKLTDGSHTVYVKTVDNAGRESSVVSKTITVVLEDPSSYSWSKEQACDAEKFERIVNIYPYTKFKKYIDEWAFRQAMYTCRDVTQPILKKSTVALNFMKNHSQTILVEGESDSYGKNDLNEEITLYSGNCFVFSFSQGRSKKEDTQDNWHFSNLRNIWSTNSSSWSAKGSDYPSTFGRDGLTYTVNAFGRNIYADYGVCNNNNGNCKGYRAKFYVYLFRI